MPHPKTGYRNNAGEKIPGVTSIIGRFKESGGLLHWAFEQGKAAERGEISSLYDVRDKAGEAGTLAHAMVEVHIRGQPFVPPAASEEVLEQARNSFGSYLSWERMTKLKIIEQEMSLVSERYQYGGTPDAIGVLETDSDGKLCLADWKTSNAVYPDYLIQLAAYKQLWDENHPDRILTGGYHLCRFSKSHGDFAHHYFPNLDEAFEQFLLFRRAYDIDKQLKRRAA